MLTRENLEYTKKMCRKENKSPIIPQPKDGQLANLTSILFLVLGIERRGALPLNYTPRALNFLSCLGLPSH